MIRGDLRNSLVVFIVSFGVYLATLGPTIHAGDSGDFITAAYTLGIPHAPGYPTYTILGRIFTLIPYGSIAFRINLMNALLTSLAVVVVYNTVFLLTKSSLSGIGASLMLTFSQMPWAQVALGKAYSLNALLFSILVYLAVRWRKTKEKRLLYCLAFTYGLSLTNHYSVAFILPAFIYLVWATNKKALGYGTVRNSAFLFAAGLLPYLYLPVRAFMDPPYNWGDPKTLERFFIHVTAYVHRQAHVSTLELGGSVSRFFSMAVLYTQQFSLSGVVSLIGVFYLRDRVLLWFSVLVVLLDSFYTMFLNVVPFDVAAFGIPTYVIFSLWAGFGIKRMLHAIEKTVTGGEVRGHASLAFVAILVLIPLASNYKYDNQASNRIAYYYGMDLLATVENNSVIFAEGDNEVFILHYLLFAENVKPGVVVYDMNGYLSHKLYGTDYAWLPEAEHNERQDKVEYGVIKSGRPVYYTSKRNMKNMPGYKIIQTGLLYKVMLESEAPPKRDYWSLYDTTGFDDPDIYKDYMTRDIVATYHTRKGAALYTDGYVESGTEEFQKASTVGMDIPEIHSNLGKLYLDFNLYEGAIEEYNISINLEPDNARSHNSLGYAYISSGNYKNGVDEYLKAIRMDPYYSTARYNLASVLFEGKDYDKALREYLFITTYDPNYAPPYKNIGVIYYQKGDYGKAAGYWSKFLELKPDDVDAQELRKRIAEVGGQAQ